MTPDIDDFVLFDQGNVDVRRVSEVVLERLSGDACCKMVHNITDKPI